MAIKVVRWMCSDGSLFVRKKDAEAHDADIAQRKKGSFHPLSEQRELCKECYNWLTQEDVGEFDFPHCSCSDDYDCNRYMYGLCDECPKRLIQ